MSETPFTADSLATAQGAALGTLTQLLGLSSDVEWTDAQAEVEKVRLNAAVVILSQQAPFDPSEFAAMFEQADTPEQADEPSLETVHSIARTEPLDPHGAPPISR